MDFLAGDGEMARRIRETDWSAHPFGPPENWPQSLRSALSICLNSAFPTAIYWGPELRLLYNDAWAPIPGPRHPASLGAPAREVWSDIWSIIEPQFNEVIRSGSGLFLEDQMLPMQRFGYLEETYWNYSFTPMRGELGEIVGVWNSGSETTENVIQRRNAECMVKLNEALRNCTSAQDGMQVSLERLGTHLGADLVGLAEFDGSGTAVPLCEVYTPQSSARRPEGASMFGPALLAELKAGMDVFVSRGEAGQDPETAAYMSARNLASGVLVPWLSGGALHAVLYIHWSRHRSTGVLDVALVEKVLETVISWAELERARAREAVMSQEIDHRARNILAILRAVARLISAETVADYKAKLDDRIAALARIHGLLSQRKWDGLTLREVIEVEIATFGVAEGVRLSLSGPEVSLPAGDAQLLAMMIHEMSTNALKHGALGDPEGALEVDWSVRSEDGAVLLRWVEQSGLIVPEEAQDDLPRGFGTVLLQRVVQDHFQGQIEQAIAPGQFSYAVTLRNGAWSAEPSASAAEVIAGGDDPATTVLIVEDEPIIALDLAGMMEDAGYALFGQHGTVATALEALEKGMPDLALLDENLAGERSTAVLDKLMAHGVPVVIISGYDGEAMTGVPRLAKPISEAELLATLKSM
ncbi:hypothetical protein AYJ57_10925 [Salipiger sp. CCB-MM3]|uniref:HWE histidine kinase domain-containing protein n=1 Tax=Salipiger sp. CCB-MM3 TaxID=1792508 RepID=UPI00080AAC1A|nr:HWE histidine kinase domain-containing protein [Salipiger sp. CCB-MM3]ANT60829.1 hypothetical protein AYJ57_10925 [Salipiger sp. CCB-MM3]